MRHVVLIALIAAVGIGSPSSAHARPPQEIAGFALGKTIETCHGSLRMETEMPIRYHPYLNEVQIKSTGGFRSGLITFDQCANPGRIVRIKMKYADSSKPFFEKLLKIYKQRFGRDPEWRGDPFHIALAWKWSFSDDQGNNIGLILQHNLKDEDEKRGNAVKLILYNGVEEARACYESRQAGAPEPPEPVGPVDWDRLIPH